MKVVIITGLTASGKSGLGIELARKFNGEIISADSVQIYRDLNIGSAKESEKILKEIPHHLINIKNFNETYNVGEFILDVQNALKDITSRNKLPIIVGGTGMYVKALMEGYSLGETEADNNLRLKYQEMAQNKGNSAVWEELNKLNPEMAKNVHPNNLKRLIRYIEITSNKGTLNKTESILKDYDVLCLGIIADRDQIYNKINVRVDQMLDEGLLQEVKVLIDKGAARDMQAFNSIGYKEWFDYFAGNSTKEETINLIKQHTRNYCKRQLTFLKTIKNIELCSLVDARKKAEDFITKKD